MFGCVPLSYAAERGHAEVVALLLKKDGIQVNQPDGTGRTPLSKAAENRDGRIVQMLLRRPEILGWTGWRPHRRIGGPPPLPVGHDGPRSAMYMKYHWSHWALRFDQARETQWSLNTSL